MRLKKLSEQVIALHPWASTFGALALSAGVLALARGWRTSGARAWRR